MYDDVHSSGYRNDQLQSFVKFITQKHYSMEITNIKILDGFINIGFDDIYSQDSYVGKIYFDLTDDDVK